MDALVIGGDPAKTTTYTGTAGSTATFPNHPQALLVWTTTDAYVTVGEGVTATSSDLPIPANIPVILYVPRGSGAAVRASAIQISAGGSIYAKPVGGASL